MRLSTVLPFGGDPQRCAQRARDLEAGGVDMLWVPELYGFDAVSILGYLAARRDRSPRLFAAALAVLALLLVQMGIGEIQWRTHLPWRLILRHRATRQT